ncbi:hypothetical protein [Collinsella ihumii]|uniref:Uncharacterized protein n=1 Tax=Collinsella ihumii TaxID=1720204 RepID=A0AAW7JT35_9ACTN|nr:hypothetical protein [Collinsella ihumii]MDN0068791.1 hypothetical protein [Collinsella ihumii]
MATRCRLSGSRRFRSQPKTESAWTARDFLGRREDPFYDVPVQEVEVSIEA